MNSEVVAKQSVGLGEPDHNPRVVLQSVRLLIDQVNKK